MPRLGSRVRVSFSAPFEELPISETDENKSLGEQSSRDIFLHTLLFTKPYNTKKREAAEPTTSLLRDPAGTQTQDLQNRNLTLYSLSYGAESGCKSIKKVVTLLINILFFCSHSAILYMIFCNAHRINLSHFAIFIKFIHPHINIIPIFARQINKSSLN